jgi:hypothetical protein
MKLKTIQLGCAFHAGKNSNGCLGRGRELLDGGTRQGLKTAATLLGVGFMA